MSLNETEFSTVYAYDAVKSDEKMAALSQAVWECDLMIAAYPVYVDTIPAALTAVFEYLHDSQRAAVQTNKPAMAVIANCGYPESIHAKVSLAVCRLFAESSQFTWLGGLALGAGPMVFAVPFTTEGGPLKQAAASLKEAAGYLAEKKEIPEAVQRQFAAVHFPSWLYRGMANLGWFQSKRQHPTRGSLKARPYDQ
jgi:hypothetical protein